MDPVDPRATICIAGMHRSGTSMTARLLNLCGVFLGPRDGMLPPQPDNPSGFWELRRFVDINEALLALRGGAWDRPPAVGLSSADPEIAPLRLQALQLATEFRGHEPWGFKDPRNSLTLDFWRAVLGPISLVICVRNPRDVVRSLQKRGSSIAGAYRVWEAHYRALLRNAGDVPSIFVHYESFFIDAPRELRRLTAFLGLDVPEANLRAACGSIDEDLRRNISSWDDLIDSEAPASVVELYAELRRRAGGVKETGGSDRFETTTSGDVLALRVARAARQRESLSERCAQLTQQLEQERKAADALRNQMSAWRALAEKGEAVRGAWRKMTLLLADRDPELGIQRHGVELLDQDLREAVQAYAMSARDEGQAAVAEDLERLGRLIDAVMSGPRPAGEPVSSGLASV